jgi:hypothetical protein
LFLFHYDVLLSIQCVAVFIYITEEVVLYNKSKAAVHEVVLYNKSKAAVHEVVLYNKS